LSVLGVPLTLDSGATAALNIFAPTADVFDAAAIRKAEMFAAQAEKALRLAVRVGVQQQLAADLRTAMESRTAIDLAAGIIMGQNRCSQAEAMAWQYSGQRESVRVFRTSTVVPVDIAWRQGPSP
jgi:hypothetical protein